MEKIEGYTPGPWCVFEEDEGFDGIPFISVAAGHCPSPDFVDVCHVQCTLDDDDDLVITDRDRANAELIAMAPELYEENTALKAELDAINRQAEDATEYVLAQIAAEQKEEINILEAENAKLREALTNLIPYAQWQIKEGLDCHPTLPSALDTARAALGDEQ